MDLNKAQENTYISIKMFIQECGFEIKSMEKERLNIFQLKKSIMETGKTTKNMEMALTFIAQVSLYEYEK